MIRILGLDPGLAETGYGIIEEQGGGTSMFVMGDFTRASMELENGFSLYIKYSEPHQYV
jgi:Holliday junction resolvasome RuvABC endonuclease subunit